MTASRWPYFSLEELKCHCGECKSSGNEMDNQFMQVMVIMRQKVGFALPVDSAYRCPAYNNKISSSGFHGAHTTGKAMDVGIRGAQAIIVLKEALAFNIGGIGVEQKGEHRFIHLDSCMPADGLPRPMIWSY
jgi:zinc D-Ala-D-Ala carboxypeptidase